MTFEVRFAKLLFEKVLSSTGIGGGFFGQSRIFMEISVFTPLSKGFDITKPSDVKNL